MKHYNDPASALPAFPVIINTAMPPSRCHDLGDQAFDSPSGPDNGKNHPKLTRSCPLVQKSRSGLAAIAPSASPQAGPAGGGRFAGSSFHLPAQSAAEPADFGSRLLWRRADAAISAIEPGSPSSSRPAIPGPSSGIPPRSHRCLSLHRGIFNEPVCLSQRTRRHPARQSGRNLGRAANPNMGYHTSAPVSAR